jgi:hypothetical protein
MGETVSSVCIMAGNVQMSPEHLIGDVMVDSIYNL